MPTNQQAQRANYVEVIDFVRARMEIEFARHEQRAATVRLDEAAALGERIARVMGEDTVNDLDAYVGVCVHRALGHQLREGGAEDIRATETYLAEDFGESTFKLLAQYIDVQAKVHVQKAENRGDGLQRVTLPATVTAQTRSTPTTYYVGTWEAGATYNRGAMVTDKGKLWHCEKDGTRERPGASPAFKMMHK